MFGVIITIAAVAIVAYMVLKQYYAPIVLLLIGLALLVIASLMGVVPITGKSATNFIGFDYAQAFTDLLKRRLPGLGLNIMAIAGFAYYMDKIGASKALVKICVSPLQRIKSPYVLLALTYVVGQFIALFVNSAVGLGLLLMASVFPLLVALGVSRAAAAAVIATTCCLDLGPSSSNAMRAADLIGTDVVTYFVQGQVPVAICVIATVAFAHFFIQRWFDKKDGHQDAEVGEVDQAKQEEVAKALDGAGPSYFAILPMLPLVLLIFFSPMVYKGIKLQLVTAIVVSLLIALLFDLINRKNLKESLKGTQAIFEGMGKVFTSTVSLIACAELFALGLSKIGGVTTMIQAAASMQGAGIYVMLAVMMGIMAIAAIVTGSGNAAFFAFSPLLPEAATSVGISTVVLAVPVQLAAGIARTMSPIAGVMIAVSSIAGLSPIAIVRRTIPVMLCAMVATVVSSLIFL